MPRHREAARKRQAGRWRASAGLRLGHRLPAAAAPHDRGWSVFWEAGYE